MLTELAMKNFEREIITELFEESEIENAILEESIDIGTVEFSGYGYFLVIRHAALPSQRLTFSVPDIRGKLGNVEVGFLAFVENSELVLECHSYDQKVFPEHRNQEFVRIAT